MLAILELMKNHGVADTNTEIPGIWRKIRQLYNLPGLDEREDAPDEDVESPSPLPEFTLPEEEYGELMAQRRLDPQSTDSPLTTPRQVPGPSKGKKAMARARTRSPSAEQEGEQDSEETLDGVYSYHGAKGSNYGLMAGRVNIERRLACCVSWRTWARDPWPWARQ